MAYRNRAPYAELAVPTTKHLDPLFVALGSALESERVIDVFAGFQHRALSMRSCALGS